jgi:hypothetical protein
MDCAKSLPPARSVSLAPRRPAWHLSATCFPFLLKPLHIVALRLGRRILGSPHPGIKHGVGFETERQRAPIRATVKRLVGRTSWSSGSLAAAIMRSVTRATILAGGIKMYILRIEHPVPDYDTWKASFDSDPIGRERSGVRRYRILRPTIPTTS